jgi:hypothetical protein
MRTAFAIFAKSATRRLPSLTLLAVGGLGACDSALGGTDGPLTGCTLSFAEKSAGGRDFGEACTQDSECRFGACLKPGTGGNITNAQFGFCTRGCDCEDNAASRLSTDEKEVLECLYPSGFKDLHHVVVECDTVDDCKAISEQWTECKIPDTGSVRRVCHAL